MTHLKASPKRLYLTPQIEYRKSLNYDAEEELLNRGNKKFVQDLYELCTYDFITVVSEPGNGKSRLLKELVIQSYSHGFDSFFLDLKKLKGKSIENRILECLKNPKDLPLSDDEVASSKDYFFSKNFGLNNVNPNILVCLDALDEVKKEDLYHCIDEIKSFKASFSNIKITLSCRSYLYKKNEDILSEINVQLVELQPFSPYNVNLYLKAHSFTEKEVKQVTDHFYKGFKVEIINSPRILEIFVKLKEKETLSKALQKSKAELLEHFIYGELNSEDEKANKNHKELIQRVLEKLALTMEVYQSKQITKDELLTFFDDVNSSLTNTFLTQVKLDDFNDRGLLITSEDGSSIQFQNAEFQEYLAAKEITRFSRIDQALFDLVIDKKLEEVFSSWTNTIKYLIELKPAIQVVLVEFICRKKSGTNKDLIERVLLSDTNKVHGLSEEDKNKVFFLIYDLCKENKWYLNYQLASKISLYLNSSSENQLKVDFVDNDDILTDNIVAVIDNAFEYDIPMDKSYWKERFTTILKTTNIKHSVYARVISALSNLKDLSVFKANIASIPVNSDILHELLKAVAQIDPNDPYSIDLIIESMRSRNYNSYPRFLLTEITSLDGIKNYLNKIYKDEKIYHAFKTNLPDKFQREEMIENISKVYCKDIKDIIINIALSSNIYIHFDFFLQDLINLVKSKEPNIILDFTKEIKKIPDYLNSLYKCYDLLGLLLSNSNFELFINEIGISEENKFQLAKLIYNYFKSPNTEESKAIFDKSKKYFSEQYTEFEKQKLEYQKQYERPEPDVLQTLRYKLEPEEGKYYPDVFDFYKQNKSVLDDKLTSEDYQRMKFLLEDVVLRFDFSGATMEIKNRKDDNSKEYTYSNLIPIFAEALEVMNDFGIDANKYRNKILEYLPYSLTSKNPEKALEVLAGVTKGEIDDLFKFYNKPRKDDFFELNVFTFFYLCKRLGLKQAKEKLKEIVLSDVFRDFEKREALEIINTLTPDFDFYKSLVDNSKLEEQLIVQANGYLIGSDNKFQKEAIKWRIDKILNSSTKTIGRHRGFDDELESGHLMKPLSSISDNKYFDDYLSFLNSAIDLYKLSPENIPYATFIWKNVMNYVDRLKNTGTYLFLEKLESEIVKKKDFEGYNVLNNLLSKIKISYANELGKPNSFAESIRIYNKIKTNSYNNVSTAQDFFYLIKEIIEIDISEWVKKEGAYQFMHKFSEEEELIQKTIKTQFENGLLRKGLRDHEVRIRREEQLLDNKRTDFVISYGFIGQVLIEIKRVKNSDVRDKKYPDKLIQYIDGTKSDYGIFLIFQTDDKVKWLDVESEVISIYEPHTKKIKVIGMDCTA